MVLWGFLFCTVLQFSQISIFWRANASSWVCPDANFWKRFFWKIVLSCHTTPGSALAHPIVSLRLVCVWLSFLGYTEGKSLVTTSPETSLSGCFFLGSFPQILRGSTDPKKGEELLVCLHLDSSELVVSLLSTLRQYQRDIQKMIGSNSLEVWQVNRDLEGHKPATLRTKKTQGTSVGFSLVRTPEGAF